MNKLPNINQLIQMQNVQQYNAAPEFDIQELIDIN